jgi:hypothetical protein
VRTWTYELDTVERAEAKGEKRIVVSVKRLRATLEAAQSAAERQRAACVKSITDIGANGMDVDAVADTPLVTEFEP